VQYQWVDGNDEYERAHQLAQYFATTLGEHHVSLLDHPGIYAIDGRIPLVVLRPDMPEAVAHVLATARRQHASVVPWGGGTQMALGYPLTHYDIALSLENLNAIEIGDPSNGVIRAQAGVTIASLDAALAPSRRLVALDGAHNEQATLGGRLATNTIGLRHGHYGSPRDLVYEMRIATGDGSIISTRNFSTADYDMNRIFIGALGTLGIIIDATIRTETIPEHESTIIASFQDTSTIWSLMGDLLLADVHPTALVVCSPGCLANGRGLGAVQADLIEPASHPLLIARLGGKVEHVQRQALMVRSICLKYGSSNLLMLRDTYHTTIWDALENLSTTRDLAGSEAVLRVGVLPIEVGQVVEFVRGFCIEHGLRAGWLADANSGTVWLRLTHDSMAHKGVPFSDWPNSETGDFAASLHMLQILLVRRWRNAIVLGCPRPLKHGLPLWGSDPHGTDMVRVLKGSFDPATILNPGRFEDRTADI
jgi:glycolate oxidase FAD binding subunit